MVKGKKKTFLPFNSENSSRIATQKKVQDGDKPQKPPRPPKQQHGVETSDSTAENMSQLSLQDPASFPNHSQSDPTFSPPLKPPEQSITNTPSYNSIVKGDVKPISKKEKYIKLETHTNLENVVKHMPTSAASKSVTHESTDQPPAPKSVWNIPEPPMNPEPLSQASNWVRSAPPVSTPKPFSANLDSLTLNIPPEPSTVSVPSQSGATAETTVQTPTSATLNVDAPVFQPKSAQSIPEFVPQPPVEIPVSTPETTIEYVYDENPTHQQGYTDQIYPSEVPLASPMVAPEYYPSIAPLMPYLAPADPMAYSYQIPAPISNPAEVHHITTEIPPNYSIPDLQNSTAVWQTQHVYHEDVMDPNRDPNRAHRGVYGPGMSNRGHFNQRYDTRRNSGQNRTRMYRNRKKSSGKYFKYNRHNYSPYYYRKFQEQRGYPTSNTRRDSRDSEPSEHSSNYNQRGPPRHQYVAPNDRDGKRSARPKTEPRPEYPGRSSNNNHNKNRDQNQIRQNEGTKEYEKSQQPQCDPVDNWDDDTTSASGEHQSGLEQNHQEQVVETSSQNQHENSFDPNQQNETGYVTPSNDAFGGSSTRGENRVSPEKNENWREPRGGSSRGNPKDYRMDKERDSRGKSKREENQRQPTLDYYWGFNSEGSQNDKKFKHFSEHWEDYRVYTNVEEVSGDLFAMGKEFSLAHCVAEDMRMGSGIAVNFKREFKCQAELLNQRAKPGGLAVLEQEGRYIYYLVTKKQSVGKPTYYTLWSSLKKMRDHIVEKEVKKLALPRIGCGLDKLEWTTVKNMIQFLFEGVDVRITVCNFQQIEEQQQMASPPTPKQYTTCKTVPVSYPVCEIEQGTIIVFLTTETGHVSQVMQDLDKKFNFLRKFKESPKKLGEIFVHEDFQKNYVLCGCIVRKTPKDLIDFVSLSKCASAINKYNRQQGFLYVGFQTVSDKDCQEDDVNNRIITILINYLKKVDVYICGDNNVKREE